MSEKEMKNTPTPHIEASPEDFAPTVLMPGDPLRAQFIAEHYLENAVLVNNVRGIQGYTGTYKGTRVSVMASGMGMPSIGIYSYELFNFFGVENIIRVGTAGGLSENVHVRDIVIAMGACTNSNFASQYGLPGAFAPIASYGLMNTAIRKAQEQGAVFHVGNCLSSDTFYSDDADAAEKWAKMGVLCVEMEAAALYMNAARAGRNALGIFTVSDNIITGEATTSEERQISFTQMMEIALETAVALAGNAPASDIETEIETEIESESHVDSNTETESSAKTVEPMLVFPRPRLTATVERKVRKGNTCSPRRRGRKKVIQCTAHRVAADSYVADEEDF